MPTLKAQLNYTGEINPSIMTRTSDQSQINLPFRLLSLDLGFTRGSIDIKTVSSVEYRYDKSESTYDLREAYFAYYPEWGEVKLGKQIHAWGAADGNNPTDNLNPYDYYYMFHPGTDKKIGMMSFSTKIYFNNIQMEGIINPKHGSNRMPFGEKDFPLIMSQKPVVEYEVDGQLEVGIRIQSSTPLGDYSFSIFKGNDRMPSLLTANVTFQDGAPPVITQFNLGYRTTTVWGMDFVTFVGDFTLRGETAIFNTQSPLLKINLFKIPLDLYEIHQEAAYVQSVLQVEYTTASDINFSGQVIISNISSEKYDWFHSSSQELVQIPNPEFRPGMGTPFAMISDKAVLFSANGIMMDDRLELKGNTMVNLDKKGSMFSASVGYSPWLNWKVEAALIQFNGDKEDPENTFTQMEDFSHLRLGLFYNF